MLALTVMSLALSASPSRADDASEAQLQFELGANLYGQRRYAEALEHFTASNRLVPNPSVTFNIAQTYGLLERWPEAFNWYETYLTRFELEEAARARGRAAQDAVRRHVAVLGVATEPVGAALYVDRVELGSVGTAPREIAVDPGAHTLIARLESHREAQHRWTAVLGGRADVALELVRMVGTLLVRSEPSGAHVFVVGSDVPLGVTPLEVSIGVGHRRLRIGHDGYAAATRSVTIVESEATSLEVSLSRLASSVAALSVTAPEGAAVAIDGVAVGTAPLTLGELTPGTHRVQVSREGREPWTGGLVFEAGGATRISAVLEDPSAVHFEDLRFVSYAVGGASLLAGGGVALGAFMERESFFATPTRPRLDSVGALNTAADVLLVSALVVLGATLVVDLVVGGRPRSRADVVVDR